MRWPRKREYWVKERQRRALEQARWAEEWRALEKRIAAARAIAVRYGERFSCAQGTGVGWLMPPGERHWTDERNG